MESQPTFPFPRPLRSRTIDIDEVPPSSFLAHGALDAGLLPQRGADRRRRHGAILFFCRSCLFYAPSAQDEFIFDEQEAILANPYVRASRRPIPNFTGSMHSGVTFGAYRTIEASVRTGRFRLDLARSLGSARAIKLRFCIIGSTSFCMR